VWSSLPLGAVARYGCHDFRLPGLFVDWEVTCVRVLSNACMESHTQASHNLTMQCWFLQP